jgi:hypothetical protein
VLRLDYKWRIHNVRNWLLLSAKPLPFVVVFRYRRGTRAIATDMHKKRSMHKMWSTEIRVEWCYRRNISMLHELFSKILDDTCATLSVEYTAKRTPSKSCRKSSSDHWWGEIRMQYNSGPCQWMFSITDSIRGASSYWPIRMGNLVFCTIVSQQGNRSPKVKWSWTFPRHTLVEVKEIRGCLNIIGCPTQV